MFATHRRRIQIQQRPQVPLNVDKPEGALPTLHQFADCQQHQERLVRLPLAATSIDVQSVNVIQETVA